MFSLNSFAADSLSYSGRLVKADGSPVAGPVDLKIDLSYTDFPNTILCSQNFSTVALSNGVFHLKLDLVCPGPPAKTVTEILTSVPATFSAALRVKDVTNNKTYAFQEIHSMPFATISETAKQVAQLGAVNGEVLKWNDTTKKWEPGTPGGGGTVTSVSGTLPISVATGSSTPVISMTEANTSTSGYLSSADWNTFNTKEGTIAGGTALQYYRGDKSWQTLNTSVIPESGVTNLYFSNARALGVPLDGFVAGPGVIVATDTLLQAFGKAQGQINLLNSASANYLIKNGTDSITGTVTVASPTGFLRLIDPPAIFTDATNMAYVDSRDDLKINKAGDTMSGVLTLDNDLKIKGGANYVTLKGHATSAAYNLFLPQTAGTNGFVLSTDGSGNTTWINPASVANGTDTVTSASIVDGSIVDADINASAAIAQTKIANLSADLAGKEPTVTNPSDTTKYYRGDKSWQALNTTAVAEGSNLYFLNSRVLGADLLGLNTGVAGPIVAADTVLGALGKLQYQVTDLKAQGQWDKNVNDIYYDTGNVGIGTTTPGSALDIKGTLRLSGSTSGYVGFAPAAVAGSTTYTLPASDGSAGQILKTNGVGVLSWVTDNSGAGAFSGAINSAVTTNGAGALSTSTTSATELGYVSGVTSSIQTQLNTKQSTALPSTNILVGNGSNVATAVAMSGDATLANTGAVTLKNTGTAGTYSSVTTDAQGRVTAGTNPVVVASITGTAPVTIGGTATAPVVAMAAATTAVNGYLTSANWNTFNGKQAALSAGATINGIVYPANAGQTLQIPLAPAAATDAVNKQYVDSFGQWGVSAGNVYRTTGNVGIGTSTPSGILHINTPDATPNILLSRTGNVTNFAARVSNNGSNDVLMIANNADNNKGIHLESTGNVGIGTTAPNAKLQVTGTNASVNDWGALAIGGLESADHSGLAMGYDTTNAWSWIYSRRTNVGSRPIVLNQGTMFVGGSGGNIGVLTTTPTSALDVNGVITKTGSISKTLSYAVATATNVTINLPNGGTTLVDGYVYKFNLATQATGTGTGSAYIVYQTGVGTWSSKLVSSNGSTSNHPLLQVSGTNVQIFHNHAATYTIGVLAEAIQTGNTTIVSPHYFGLESAITNIAGNVGIGTITPQTKLDVNGAIRLGTDATVCSAANAGAMRFSTPNVEYCNGTAWTIFGVNGAAVASTQITDGTIVDADVNAAANITASKLGTGAVDNTEFNYLNGVTSAIQTQLNNKQPLDATLTSLAAYNTNGILVQTAVNTFIGRSVAGTANRVGVSNGDGILGNPVINLDTTLFPSPLAGDAGKFLKTTGANASAWSVLASSDVTGALGYTPVNKAGDSLTTGTIALSGAAALTVQNPINVLDVANKQYVDSYGQWTKNASDIYRSTGNVGVGIASPVSKLDVVSSTNQAMSVSRSFVGLTNTAGAFIGGTDTATTNTGIYVVQKDASGLSSNGTFLLNVVQNSLSKMLVTGAGNVGIGTTTPTVPLEVKTSATTGFPAIRVADYTDTSGVSIQSVSGGSYKGIAADSYYYNGGLYRTVNTNSSMINLSGGTFKVLTDSGLTANTDFTPTERMRITSSGNVGIGTSAPDRKFQVTKANASSSIRLDGFIAGTNMTPMMGAGSDFGSLIEGADNGQVVLALRDNDNNDGFRILSGGGNFMTDSIYDTAVFTALSNGNVGIGTTAPTDLLTLNNGNLGLRTDGGVGNNTRAKIIPLYDAGGSNYGGALAFQTTSNLNVSTEAMRITKEGNIGIGTTTPLAELHVEGEITSRGGSLILQRPVTAGGWARGMMFTPDGSVNPTASGLAGLGVYGTATTQESIFLTFGTSPWASSTGIQILPSGNVGMGTTTPTSRLQVIGTTATDRLNVGGTGYGLLNVNVVNDNSAGYSLHYPGVSAWQLGRRGGSFSIAVTGGAGTDTMGTDFFSITQAGKIGIGMLNATYQLQLSTDSAAKPGTSTWTIASDERLKDIRAPFSRGLDAVEGINPIYFRYKEGNPLDLPTEKEYVGIKAQDAAKFIPEAVHKDEKGFLHVTNDAIIWTMLNGLKELYHRWTDDKALVHREIASVKSENAQLKANDLAKDKKIKQLEKDNLEIAERLKRLEQIVLKKK